MFKLYEVRYVNAGTEEYYCNFVEISDDPDKLIQKYEANKDNEDVEVVEFKRDGFEIIVKELC